MLYFHKLPSKTGEKKGLQNPCDRIEGENAPKRRKTEKLSTLKLYL
jgi:hypothetical protein